LISLIVYQLLWVVDAVVAGIVTGTAGAAGQRTGLADLNRVAVLALGGGRAVSRFSPARPRAPTGATPGVEE
jgi:hypothetical protein